MAEVYKLKTAIDDKIKYDNIQVDIIEEQLPKIKSTTVLEQKNVIKNIQSNIERLLVEKKEEENKLSLIEAEAIKVKTAIK